MAVPTETESIVLVAESASVTLMKEVKLTHNWTISRFDELLALRGECIKSSMFSISNGNNRRWQLILYPQGNSCQGFISVFIKLVSYNKPNIRIKTILKFSLLKVSGEKGNLHETSKVFNVGSDWGFNRFTERDFILDKKNGFLTNGKLTINCELTDVMDSEAICEESKIQTKDQKASLSDDLGLLFNDKKLSDIVILVRGQELQAHKSILAARSLVFAAMFQHGWEEMKQNKVEIPDMDPKVVEEMLRFIYTGKVTNVEKTAEELLKAADKYQLEGLKEVCEEVLCTGLSVETAADYLILADLHKADRLKERVVAFLNKHGKDVKKTPGFQALYTSHSHLLADAWMSIHSSE